MKRPIIWKEPTRLTVVAPGARKESDANPIDVGTGIGAEPRVIHPRSRKTSADVSPGTARTSLPLLMLLGHSNPVQCSNAQAPLRLGLPDKADGGPCDLVFGPNEKRQLRAMRRAGALEEMAGGVELTDLAIPMVNETQQNLPDRPSRKASRHKALGMARVTGLEPATSDVEDRMVTAMAAVETA